MNSFNDYDLRKVPKSFKRVAWVRNFPILLVLSIISLCSCEPEPEKPAGEGDIQLSFSADTVLFDTIFTEIRSITKRVKLYNSSKGSINIEEISLSESATSPFTIYVNGEKGKTFNNIHLLGRDSLLILVEAAIDHQDEDLPFVIEDKLQVKAGNSSYVIPVIAWGQDAVFLKDIVLSCNTRFTADRPYVLYGAVLVDTLCSLEIDPGARIYNHYSAGLYVMGSLKVNGTAEKRVTISNDRFEERYANAPGQWRGIYFLEGSFDNAILFADIKNAEVGVRIGNPDDDDDFDLVIGHTSISNISTAGILSFTSDVFVYNTLIHNCVMASVAAVAGGNYRFWNNTFANYSYDFFREDATLILADNVVLADNTLLVSDLHVELKNNIIWGSTRNELVISDTEGAGNAFFSISNNIIRTLTDTLAANNILNTDPLFLDPSEYNYQLDSSSVAIDAGISLPDLETDLQGTPRINLPDLGAFENQ